MIRHFPLLVYVSFSVVTFVIFFLNPIQYKDFSLQTTFYLFASFALNCFFYFLGIRVKVRESNLNFDTLIIELYKISIFFLIFKIFYSFLLFYQNGYSIFGDAYVSSYDGYQRGQGSLGPIYFINILADFFIYIYLICSVYLFIFLKRQAGFFLLVVFVLLTVLFTGKQKILGDLFIVYLFLFMSRQILNSKNTYFFRFLIIILIFVALLCLLLYSRYSSAGIDANNIVEKINPHTYWNEENILVLILNPVVVFPIAMLMNYFTNGIYGLNITLQMDYTFSYMLGSSYSAGKIVERIIDTNIFSENTYPFLAENYGWGLNKWHTLYSWLASDFTFFGALIIVAIMFFYLGILWKTILIKPTLLEFINISYLMIGIIFIYSNNQMMHSLSGLMFFLFFNILQIIKNSNAEKRN